MRTITTTYASFSELTTDQQKAYYDVYGEKFTPNDQWHELIIEGIREALQMVGFSNVEIGFSGFWSQGDGAHFTGSYSYKKGSLEAIKQEYPQWEELHKLAQTLQELEAKNFYSITFNIDKLGNYSHALCTTFEFFDTRNTYQYTSSSFDEQPYKEACREFMKHIYTSLEKEYDYLNSWEYVKENPEAFDYIEIALESKVS